MSSENIASLISEIQTFKSNVDNIYANHVTTLSNANYFIDALSNATSASNMYTRFNTLVVSSNVTMAQDYTVTDTLSYTFQLAVDNSNLKFDDTGNSMCLKSGNEMTLGLFVNSNVYNNSNGCVAIFNRETTQALKIATTVNTGKLSFAKFVPNDPRFSWCFLKTDSGKYELHSDFGGNQSTTIGYNVDAFYPVSFDKRNRSAFSIVGTLSNSILTPNRPGLKVLWIDTYFNELLNTFNSPPSWSRNLLCTNISTLTSGLNGYRFIPKSSVRWTGYFYAPVSGTYTFYINARDCAYFWIGTGVATYSKANALISKSAEVSKTVTLVSGTYYPLLIMFGNSTATTATIATATMQFSWLAPSGTKTSTAPGYLFLNPP